MASENLVKKVLELREAGYSVKDACEQLGVSTPTYYKRKAESEKQELNYEGDIGSENEPCPGHTPVIALIGPSQLIAETCKQIIFGD